MRSGRRIAYATREDRIALSERFPQFSDTERRKIGVLVSRLNVLKASANAEDEAVREHIMALEWVLEELAAVEPAEEEDDDA